MKQSRMILWIIACIFLTTSNMPIYHAQRPLEHWVTWLPNGNQVLVSSENSVSLISATETDNVSSRFNQSISQPRATTTSPDGRFFAIADGKQVEIYSTDSLENLAILETVNSDTIWLSWSPDGKYLAAISYEEVENLKVWDSTSYELVINGSLGQIFQAAWDPMSQYLAYVNVNNKGIYTIDLKAAITEIEEEDKEVIHTLSKSRFYHLLDSKTVDDVSSSIAWSQTGSLIAVGNYDGGIIFFDVEAQKFSREFQAHNQIITAIDFSPDGKFLVSAGQDGFVRVWAVDSGKLVNEYAKGDIFTRQIDFSPDGSQLAFGVATDIAESLQLTGGVQIVTVTEKITP